MHFLHHFFIQYTVKLPLGNCDEQGFKMCIHYAQVVKYDSNLTV